MQADITSCCGVFGTRQQVQARIWTRVISAVKRLPRPFSTMPQYRRNSENFIHSVVIILALNIVWNRCWVWNKLVESIQKCTKTCPDSFASPDAPMAVPCKKVKNGIRHFKNRANTRFNVRFTQKFNTTAEWNLQFVEQALHFIPNNLLSMNAT